MRRTRTLSAHHCAGGGGGDDNGVIKIHASLVATYQEQPQQWALISIGAD